MVLLLKLGIQHNVMGLSLEDGLESVVGLKIGTTESIN